MCCWKLLLEVDEKPYKYFINKYVRKFIHGEIQKESYVLYLKNMSK